MSKSNVEQRKSDNRQAKLNKKNREMTNEKRTVERLIKSSYSSYSNANDFFIE